MKTTGKDVPSVAGFLTYRFGRVQSKLNEQGGRILARVAGITVLKWRILSLVGDRDMTTSAEIVERSNIDKALVSRTLKALQEDGLVLSATSPRDGRVVEHTLTDQGRALFERTLPVMRERQRLIRSAFTPEELSALESALMRLEEIIGDPAYEP